MSVGRRKAGLPGGAVTTLNLGLPSFNVARPGESEQFQDARKRAGKAADQERGTPNLSNPLRDALGHWRPCLKGGRYLVHAHDIPW